MISGGAEIIRQPLNIVEVANALVIPMGRPRKPGVFDADGHMVPEAKYRRGLPTLHLPLEDEHAICLGPDADYAPEGFRYIYVGHLTAHYGHFLFASLARLWSLPRPLPQDVRLVALNGNRAVDLFDLEFSRAIFGALGITRELFVEFSRPMKFAKLIVPEPSVEENIGGHAHFADLCHWIGDAVSSGRSTQHDRPLFLTKSRLRSGIYRVINEDVVCEALARRGFDIVAPEQLTFSQQVMLGRGKRAITGFAGSTLLTSIFTPGRRYTALTTDTWVNSNQVTIDLLNNNDGAAYRPEADVVANLPGNPFQHDVLLHDPEGTAADLAAISQQYP